jgi:3-hydroxyisobutyrate dehydrogenase
MLPSSPHVQKAYNGEIIPALQKLPLGHNTLLIDSTTLDVSVSREVARSVAAVDATMIDAPVSGGSCSQKQFLRIFTNTYVAGVTGAKAGTLSFLVGGDESGFQKAHPVLSMMGSRIVHCGPPGAGLAAKICNNVSFSFSFPNLFPCAHSDDLNLVLS